MIRQVVGPDYLEPRDAPDILSDEHFVKFHALVAKGLTRSKGIGDEFLQRSALPD
jgi:hypothetical protein